MCGIIGYVGSSPCAPILLDGLKALEYRGYDSAGIAFISDNNKIEVKKAKGRLKVLCEQINNGSDLKSTIGIGHTRWATHGKPSDENSHPHYSSTGLFAVVHNGIIENYSKIKTNLIEKGYNFTSDTDTEVIAHLLDLKYNGDLLDTLIQTTKELEGSYALGVLCADYPDEFAVVKASNPLIIGLGTDENFIASDITAILNHTRNIIRLLDNEIALIGKDSVKVYDSNKNEIQKEKTEITWNISAAEKGGFDHFMLKEIMEQPYALNATISPRIGSDGRIVLDGIKLTYKDLANINKINIVACGSAYHVGVVGKYVIEKLTGIPVIVDVASEFRYFNPIVDDKTLVIIISQSGETADTIAALREAKKKGGRVLSIVNVVGSTIAIESDDVLYTWAGPEIAVATTKAYSTQITMMYLIGVYIADNLNKIDPYKIRRILRSLMSLSETVTKILDKASEIQKLAQRYINLDHAYFIGRNLDYAVALEASLKLKEISYIHSEAYAAGELKHGTISLIEDGTLVVALACCDRLLEKTVSNIKEVKARGAEVLAVTIEGNKTIEAIADYVLYVPETHELLMPSLEVVPMQLLSYYIALARDCDIDKPRNLAKSVTVE